MTIRVSGSLGVLVQHLVGLEGSKVGRGLLGDNHVQQFHCCCCPNHRHNEFCPCWCSIQGARFNITIITYFFLQMLQRIGKRRESLSSTLLSWRSNLLLIITILIIITLITIVAMKNMIMLEFSTLLLFWRPGHHHCDKEYEDDNNCRGQYSLCGGINDMYCSVFE